MHAPAFSLHVGWKRHSTSRMMKFECMSDTSLSSKATISIPLSSRFQPLESSADHTVYMSQPHFESKTVIDPPLNPEVEQIRFPPLPPSPFTTPRSKTKPVQLATSSEQGKANHHGNSPRFTRSDKDNRERQEGASVDCEDIQSAVTTTSSIESLPPSSHRTVSSSNFSARQLSNETDGRGATLAVFSARYDQGSQIILGDNWHGKVSPRLPKKRLGSKPLVPGMHSYLKTINPTVQRALTKCALAQPDDPALWMAKFFLAQSPAGDSYQFQRKNSVQIEQQRPTKLSHADNVSIENATKPGKGIHAQPYIKPLGIWEKRLRVDSGKYKNSEVQANPVTVDMGMVAIAEAKEVEIQTTPHVRTRACQTTLTSRDALFRLQKEAKLWVERRQRDITEDRSLKLWYDKVHTQMKLVASLRRLFLDLDTRGARTLRPKEILRGVSQNDNIQKALVHAPPSLKALANPKTWHDAFDKMDRENKGFVTFHDWERFVHANNDTNTDGVDRLSLLRALSWDGDVQTAIQQCPTLKPLLHPKYFEKTFNEINKSGSGIMTWPEIRSFVQFQREEEIHRNEEETRERAAEKARLTLEVARDKVTSTMDLLKTLFQAMDLRKRGFLYKNDILRGILQNSNVICLLRSSSALKPLLQPSTWKNTFRQVDIDGDGKINFGEWVNFCIRATLVDEIPYERPNAPSPIVIAMLEGAAKGAENSGEAAIYAARYAREKERKEGNLRAKILAKKTADAAVVAAAPPPWRLNLPLANASCVKIQARFRGNQVRVRPLAVVIEEFKQQRAWDDLQYFEATRIQAVWRGYAVRTGIVSDMEELLRYVLTEAALKIQRLWRKYCLRGIMGLGKKSRTDIWLVVQDFTARSEDEMTVKRRDVVFLFDRIEDPFVQEDGSVVGWYRACLYFSESVGTTPPDKWKILPSNCVRRMSKAERSGVVSGVMPEWVKMYDPRTVKYYYYNNFTGESAWEKPDNYVEPSKSAMLARVNMTPEMRGALAIQGAYRAKIGRRVARADYAMKNKARHIGGWVEGTDQRLKCTFWYNVKTHPNGDVVWEKPLEVCEHERNIQMKKEASALREENIVVTFGPGPLGIEFVTRKGGKGLVIKGIRKDSQAEKNGKLKKGLVLFMCNQDILSTTSLEEGLDKMRICPRPMRLIFTSIAKIKATEKSILAASKVSSLVSVQFEAGSMGLELAPKREGGAIIKMIQKDSPAAEIEQLRRGMSLMFIGEQDVSASEFATVMRFIRIMPRPVVLHFKSAPSRALNKTLLEQRILAAQHVPPKHLREQKVAPKQILVTFGPGPIGIELIARRDGGVLIKAITPGGPAAKVAGLRKSMAIMSISGRQVIKEPMHEVMRLLKNAPRPMTIEFFSMSHVHTRTEVRKAGKTIFTTFEDGPLGLELAQIKDGGVIIKEVKPGGLAEKCGKLRKSMRLLKIDDEDMTKKTVPEVIGLLKRTMRPVELEWKTAPSRKMNQQFKFERTGQVNVVIVFEEPGPLGIALVQMKRGGCMIKDLHKDGLAYNHGGLRKSMALLKVNDQNVSHMMVAEVIEVLKAAPRPLKLMWRSAPSRSLSPHARIHARMMAIENERIKNLTKMRIEEDQQRMFESEVWRREYDLYAQRFKELEKLVQNGSLTLEEAVKMAKRKTSDEDEISGKETVVEKFSEDNIEAAMEVIKKYILKGKQYAEVEDKVPDLEKKITKALVEKGFGESEVLETIRRLREKLEFDEKKIKKEKLKKEFANARG